MANHANTIRKLLDTGASRDEIENTLMTLQLNDEDDLEDASKAYDSASDTDCEWRLGKVRAVETFLPEP